MSATLAFHAPIGSIIAWSDGTPRPPKRHRKKLSAWQTSNSQGRLISKRGGRAIGNLSMSPTFTLHEGDYGAGGVIAIRVHRTFSQESGLRFTVVEPPAIGSVRVSQGLPGVATNTELGNPASASSTHWLMSASVNTTPFSST